MAMLHPTALQIATALAQDRARDLEDDPNATQEQRDQATSEAAALEQQLREREPGVLVGSMHDDREPTEEEKEATNRAVCEQELRSAYAQFYKIGTPKEDRIVGRLPFDTWLRTEAIEHPSIEAEARALIKAQDAERAATASTRSAKSREALGAAQQALTSAVDHLLRANRHATAVESLLLLPLIKAAVDARDTAQRLAAARAEDASRT